MSTPAEKAAKRSLYALAYRVSGDDEYMRTKIAEIIDEEMTAEREDARSVRSVSHTKSDTIVRLRSTITKKEERIRLLLKAMEKFLANGTDMNGCDKPNDVMFIVSKIDLEAFNEEVKLAKEATR